MRFLILFNLITLFFLWLGNSAKASVEVSDVAWQKEKDFLVLKIQFQGKIKEFPEIKVVNNKYFFQWPNATVTTKVKLPTDISMNAFSQQDSLNPMSLVFLSNFKGGDPRESNVTIKVKDQTLLLYFPPNEDMLNFQDKKVANVQPILKETVVSNNIRLIGDNYRSKGRENNQEIAKEAVNEIASGNNKVNKITNKETFKENKKENNKEQSDYLQYLLSSVAKEGAATNKIGRVEESNKLQNKNDKNNFNEPYVKGVNNFNNQNSEKIKTPVAFAADKITNTNPPTKPLDLPQKSTFSSKALGETQWTYLLRVAGSFLGVLLIVLLLAQGFKKIVLGGKGKLGFLNSTQVVEVLNTTYLGPKRQLILVRVHDQVVLLSSAENGISFLTEINDLSTLLKKGEKEISGTNFDSNMLLGQSDPDLERKVSLKDYSKINESAPLVAESKIRKALRNKVKTLNAWQ